MTGSSVNKKRKEKKYEDEFKKVNGSKHLYNYLGK